MGNQEMSVSSATVKKEKISAGNFLKALRGAIAFYRRETKEDKKYMRLDTSMGAILLIGLGACFPETISNQEENFAETRFLGSAASVMMELNDFADIRPRVVDSTDKRRALSLSWKNAFRNAKEQAQKTSNPQLNSRILLNCQKEVLIVEKAVREDHNIDPKEYREMVNAINILHLSSILLLPHYPGLKEKLQMDNPDRPKSSYPELRKKYSWLKNGDIRNPTEEKLCALFNLVMGMQVIDDWYDKKDDQKLGIPNMTTQYDSLGAKQLKEQYFQKAREYGLDNSIIKATDWLFTQFKAAMRKHPDIFGGKRERWLNGARRIIQESTYPG
jgi:hypothetical protein